MSVRYISRLVDPSIKGLATSLMNSRQMLNLLGIKDRQLFPFDGMSEEMESAQQGIYDLASYVGNPRPNPIYQPREPQNLSSLLCVLRRASNILPQQYTYNTRARAIVDGVLEQSGTYPNFTAFRSTLETQSALVENQLKSRFPMHTQG